MAPARQSLPGSGARGAASRHGQQSPPSGVNRLAIASFICALAGIPLFGIITGLVAVVLAVIALGAIRQSSQRGLSLALSGLLLGLIDIVGWIYILSVVVPWGGHGIAPDLHFSELPPDLSAIQELEPALQRAMRANVLIERRAGLAALGGKAVGSGVILQISGGEALIVTNRHVVDDDFPSSKTGASDASYLSGLGKMSVSMLGQSQGEGRVVWVAPGQIDLALIRAKCREPGQARDAPWQKGRSMKVGETVFAIGNPYHLGWTHTQGVISQMRTQTFGLHQVRVIQTQAAINPGNSGGGLYDHDGFLLGINTWTADKSVSEGIGFAIALDSLLELTPPPLEPQPEKSPPITSETPASTRIEAKGDPK
jgi:hypothetical protein